MTAIRRAFRAEALLSTRGNPDGHSDIGEAERHRELLSEMAEIKQMIRPAEEVGDHLLAKFKAEMGEAVKLKAELDAIYEAINQTKKEIATLHHTAGPDSNEMGRVANELDAVILGTEGATENILAAAEFIDETANTLSARLKGQDSELARDIQERVISIFENCNFQDLTGQRITKVVGTLRFIEDRIIHMMDIWGGIESFKGIEPEARPQAQGDAALLNGPSLVSDEGVATQDDIDALFA
ncbi:protein phosphatase CheZ [Stappia sp. F7233]|uniref:Protein phosphatase CheZ n=2 Tax=Stappia albiluteola TaxID=2758565 RepID=A0A839AHP9_9HYPH|nr:protein phosphatase CheZ [Stappia albiluteola]